MFINKIGNKCASFINHKYFHPGNLKNLEKVWLAEENERKRKEEEEKDRKKREEQVRMHFLKKQLRKCEEEKKKKYLMLENSHHDGSAKKRRISDMDDQTKVQTKNESNWSHKKSVLSIYNEDVYVNNHTYVYGSYYDREKQKWGYKCCKSIDKNSVCPNHSTDYCKRNGNNNVGIKKNLDKNINNKKKKKKKKKNTMIVDNSISAVLNKIRCDS